MQISAVDTASLSMQISATDKATLEMQILAGQNGCFVDADTSSR